MRILIVAGGYLPGFRYGGPVRSLAAIVEHLDEYDFSIVTSNHDLGESTPYAAVDPDSWTQVGKAKVWYASHERTGWKFWRQILADLEPDLIYLNSFFHPVTVAFLLWRRLGLLSTKSVLLAPRGEFSSGALNLNSLKKRSYLILGRKLGLWRDISWHMTTSVEAEDVQRIIPEAKERHIAPALLHAQNVKPQPRDKSSGEARLVFIARISPMKNLLGALEFLQKQSGKVIFDVYGPVEDLPYWDRCLEVASRLPPNVEFSYRGEVSHTEVPGTLSQYHFMLMPTLGENFGHSIAEALSHGVPVLISDRTPWRDLEQHGVGWDIALDRLDKWAEVLARCIAMDEAEYRAISAKGPNFVRQWMEDQGGLEANRRMFWSVAGLREDVSGSKENEVINAGSSR